MASCCHIQCYYAYTSLRMLGGIKKKAPFCPDWMPRMSLVGVICIGTNLDEEPTCLMTV